MNKISRRRLLLGVTTSLLAPILVRAQTHPTRPIRTPRGFFVPPGKPEINWDHPVAAGLCFCFVAGYPVDLARGGTRPTINSAASINNYGPLGTEARFGNGDSSGDGLIFGSYTGINGASGQGGDFTAMVVANPSASGTQQNFLFSQRTDTSPHDGSQVNLAANVNTSNAQASGWFTLQTFDNTNSFRVAGAASQVDGKYHAFLGRRTACGVSNAQVEAWVDGIQVNTNCTAKASIANVGNQDTAVGALAKLPGSNRAANCGVLVAFGWNRALLPTEILEVSKDPTCFLTFPDDDVMEQVVGRTVSSSSNYTPFFHPQPF